MTDYRGLIFDDTREGATDAAIEQLEANLGARLPDDYRQFLKTCNGGYVDYDVLATMAETHLDRAMLGLSGGIAILWLLVYCSVRASVRLSAVSHQSSVARIEL